MKKLLSAVIVTVMVFALAASAFAYADVKFGSEEAVLPDGVALISNYAKQPGPVDETNDAATLVNVGLELWAYQKNGVNVPASNYIDVEYADNFHVAGWIGYTCEIKRVGYSLNGENYFADESAINRSPEADVISAGGQYAIRFDYTGLFAGVAEGANNLDLIVELDDGNDTVVAYIAGYYLFVYPAGTINTANDMWLIQLNNVYALGWWTGTAIGLPAGATLDLTFTSPHAFYGFYSVAAGANVTVQVDLINKNNVVLQTKQFYLASDGEFSVYFDKAFPADTYTIRFTYLSGSHFVLYSGSAGEIAVTAKMSGFITNGDSLPAPFIRLNGSKDIADHAMVNAAFDDLKYDDTVLCSSKAYLWVHDEANRDAMDFVKGDVSQITFRGWARTNMEIAGFGYIIDDGDLVTGDFIEERADLASEPGARGYLVTVPVADLRTGDHKIAIYVYDEYYRAIEIVKVKNEIEYPIEINFTVDYDELPSEPEVHAYHVDKKKCNYAMTEFNVYGWSVFNLPVQALGYVLDDGEPVWVVPEISSIPRETNDDRLPNDIYVSDPLNKDLIKNHTVDDLDPFFAYRINVTVDITGFEVGEEHTLEILVKFNDEAETVVNAYDETTFTIVRGVPSEFTFMKDGETYKVINGATNNVSHSNNGDVIVFTTTKANDTWFEIPLDNLDSSVYTKIEIKYRAKSIWQNNVYLKDTEINKDYSGVSGTWASPGLVGDGEWHVKTYVIAETFPALAGATLTGLRIPAGTAVGDTFEVEYVALKTAEEPSAPAELVVTLSSFDIVHVNDVSYTTTAEMSTAVWIQNNPISFTEGETLKLGAEGWVFINGAAAITGMYYKIDDGEYVGGAQYLNNRPDLPGIISTWGGVYANSNAYNTIGFKFPANSVDVSSCPVGDHVMKVYALAKDADNNPFYCLILSVPFKVVEREMPQISSISLSLEQTLTMNFKVKASEFVSEPAPGFYSDPFIEVTFGGKTVTLDKYTVSGDFLVFSFNGISPEKMTDTVSAVLKAYKGETVCANTAIETSVEAYCLNLLADEGSSDELKTLLVELLQYGALTQVYTEYNLDALADANIDDYLEFDLGQYEDISPVKFFHPMTETPEVTYLNAGLRLEDSIALRIMINAENIEGLTVCCYYNDQSVVSEDFVHVSGNRYYVYLPGIYAQDMRETITVEIRREGDPVADQFIYSVADYIYVMLEDTDDQDLYDLLEGLMQYGDAAAAYAASLTV